MIKEFIEKQYFIVNFDTLDVADVMLMNEDKTEEEVLANDLQYIQELLYKNGLSMEEFEGSTATIVYNRKERALYITLDANNKEYKLSLLEFFGYEKYKKVTSYFFAHTTVKIRDVSIQIGGIIDKNYGIKFKVRI